MTVPRFTVISVTFLFGAFPFAATELGGLNVPAFVLLAPLVMLSVFVAHLKVREEVRLDKLSWIAFAGAAVLVACGALAFSFTRGSNGDADTREFLKWLVATAWILLPVVVPARWRVQIVWAFVAGTTIGAIISLLGVAGVADSAVLAVLRALGYPTAAVDPRTFLVGSTEVSVRATGPYGDPNIAALWFVAGFLLSFSLDRSNVLVAFRLVLFVGIVLAFSRGSFLGLTIAAIAQICIGRQSAGKRTAVLLALLVSAVLLMAIPVTQARIFSSFSGSDRGVNDRVESLSEYTKVMEGRWRAGYGFGRREFRESAVAYKTNVVANAPLAAAYRGGLIAAVGFLAWYLTVLALAFSNLRRPLSRLASSAALVLVSFAVTAMTGYSLALIPAVVGLSALVVGFAVVGRLPMSGSRKPVRSHQTEPSPNPIL